MEKPAVVDHEVHELIARRWSPRAFVPQSLTREQVGALLEAARWAPSCFNEQPWRYLVATRDDETGFQRMLSTLAEGNRPWAGNAGLLLIAVAKETFARNGKPNAHAWHDVGLANAQLSLQATALGLGVHQMAGFSAEAARELYAIPDGFVPVVALAVGLRDDASSLPDALQKREEAPRTRQPLSELAFAGKWDAPF